MYQTNPNSYENSSYICHKYLGTLQMDRLDSYRKKSQGFLADTLKNNMFHALIGEHHHKPKHVHFLNFFFLSYRLADYSLKFPPLFLYNQIQISLHYNYKTQKLS